MRADLRQIGTVTPMLPLLSPDLVESFGRDGAVVLRGVFSDWIETLAVGVAKNEAAPGEYFAENVPVGAPGRFWDDYVNWERIPEFERFARESDVARLAAELMVSDTVQLFHDHVLVKEPGTPTVTPLPKPASMSYLASSSSLKRTSASSFVWSPSQWSRLISSTFALMNRSTRPKTLA